MSEVAVENINVADILGAEGATEQVEQVKAALEADPEVSLLVKAAETVEDVYEIVKRYSKATLEQVKVLFEKTVDYFKETKSVLADEVLDNVVGGWSFSNWWNKNKAFVLGGVVFVACVAAGAVVGACLGGAAGALGGAAIGVVVGSALGTATMTSILNSQQKK